jgi:hypothetical protein
MRRTLSPLMNILGEVQRQLVSASVYFLIAPYSVVFCFFFGTLFIHLNVPIIQSA